MRPLQKNHSGDAAVRAILFALGTVAVLLSAPAFAQQQGPQVRVTGTVDKLDGKTLTVNSKEGKKEAIQLAADANVSTNVKRTLTDLKPGEYVGVTSVKGKNGEDRAIEVRIFDKSRVPNLNQFPLEYAPDNLMTNAAVAEVQASPEGSLLKVKFSTGESTIVVPPDTPILASAPGSMDMLKPGAKVSVVGNKGADGSISSRRITVD
jgi:hypothetical protein